MQPSNGSPYDFFLQDAPKPKRSMMPSLPSGGSFKQRLLIVAGAGLALVIILWLFFGVILGGGPSDTQDLIDLAQQQSEIVRVANIGSSKARTVDGRYLAVNVQLVIGSEQQDILDKLKSRGHALAAKNLGLDKNLQTDQKLTSADQNNRFDEAFVAEMQTELTAYQSNLQKTFKATSSASLKQLLSNDFKQVNLLLGKS